MRQLPNLSSLSDHHRAAVAAVAPTGVLVPSTFELPKMPDFLRLNPDPETAVQDIESRLADYADTLVYTKEVIENIGNDAFALLYRPGQRSDIILLRNAVTGLGVINASLSMMYNQEERNFKVVVKFQRTVEVGGYAIDSKTVTSEVPETTDNLATLKDLVKTERQLEAKYDDEPFSKNRLAMEKARRDAAAQGWAFMLRQFKQKSLPGLWEILKKPFYDDPHKTFVIEGPNNDLRWTAFVAWHESFFSTLRRGNTDESVTLEMFQFTMATILAAASRALADALVEVTYKPGEGVPELFSDIVSMGVV